MDLFLSEAMIRIVFHTLRMMTLLRFCNKLLLPFDKGLFPPLYLCILFHRRFAIKIEILPRDAIKHIGWKLGQHKLIVLDGDVDEGLGVEIVHDDLAQTLADDEVLVEEELGYALGFEGDGSL